MFCKKKKRFVDIIFEKVVITFILEANLYPHPFNYLLNIFIALFHLKQNHFINFLLSYILDYQYFQILSLLYLRSVWYNCGFPFFVSWFFEIWTQKLERERSLKIKTETVAHLIYIYNYKFTYWFLNFLKNISLVPEEKFCGHFDPFGKFFVLKIFL